MLSSPIAITPTTKDAAQSLLYLFRDEPAECSTKLRHVKNKHKNKRKT